MGGAKFFIVNLWFLLSPFLFAVYLDGLLEELSASGVGCHWRWMYAGCFCYADDIALLAPCASALRTMLSICNNYAKSHGLLFNTEKTQLLCFRYSKSYTCTDRIFFNNTLLNFTNNVIHLGHLLSFNVKDESDIIRATKDLIRKASFVYFPDHSPFYPVFSYQNLLSLSLRL